jgi:hypothetical protein
MSVIAAGGSEYSAHWGQIMGAQANSSDEVPVDPAESCQAQVQRLDYVTETLIINLIINQRSHFDSTFTEAEFVAAIKSIPTHGSWSR